MPLTSDDAFELSESLRALSVTIGNARITKWKDLSEEQRNSMEKAEWTILKASGELVTTAVGLVLDETQWNANKLKTLAQSANRAVEQLENIGDAIEVVSSVVGLVTSIASADVQAITKNAKKLYDTTHREFRLA